jgi:predicted site-specific integrase-resolvase
MTDTYTIRQVAQMLQISESRIRNLVRTGKVKPKERFGWAWVFSQEEVEHIRNRPGLGRPKKRVA